LSISRTHQWTTNGVEHKDSTSTNDKILRPAFASQKPNQRTANVTSRTKIRVYPPQRRQSPFSTLGNISRCQVSDVAALL
jgi:hypothetical protein